MLNADDLRNLCHDELIAITKHARVRLAERGISIEDIKAAIQSGEIIKQYEDDKPFPSCLLLGSTTLRNHLHVVASIGGEFLHIITAYFPDKNEWEDDMKTRKGQQS